MAAQEELAREQRAIQLAERERPHAGILRETANPDRPTMRISFVVLVFAFAGLLAVDLQSSSAPHAAVTHADARAREARREPETVEVAFVKNGWIVRVERVVPKRHDAAGGWRSAS